MKLVMQVTKVGGHEKSWMVIESDLRYTRGIKNASDPVFRVGPGYALERLKDAGRH